MKSVARNSMHKFELMYDLIFYWAYVILESLLNMVQ